jgi:hypothetical protein
VRKLERIGMLGVAPAIDLQSLRHQERPFGALGVTTDRSSVNWPFSSSSGAVRRKLSSDRFSMRQEDWISLASTKTDVVYRLQRNPPGAHE